MHAAYVLMKSLDPQKGCGPRMTAALSVTFECGPKDVVLIRLSCSKRLHRTADNDRGATRFRFAPGWFQPSHEEEIYPACHGVFGLGAKRPNMGICIPPSSCLWAKEGWRFSCRNHAPKSCSNAKKPPGNRVAFSLGRIVPTEARPSELSWRHSMGGLLGCQGQIIFAISCRFY
jgi:hypothetical protein